MANYNITASAFLRNNYSAYRQMSIKANRDEASQKELSTADSLALKKAIRSLSASPDQIQYVTDYTVSNGGISYSESRMEELKEEALAVLPSCISPDKKECFRNYLEFITHRQK